MPGLRVCPSHFLFAATVDFYLDCIEEILESGAEDGLGRVAAGLMNLRTENRIPFVAEARRQFGARPGEQAVIVGERWPLEGFAENVACQLDELAAREREPRILPEVARIWRGLAPLGVAS